MSVEALFWVCLCFWKGLTFSHGQSPGKGPTLDSLAVVFKAAYVLNVS